MYDFLIIDWLAHRQVWRFAWVKPQEYGPQVVLSEAFLSLDDYLEIVWLTHGDPGAVLCGSWIAEMWRKHWDAAGIPDGRKEAA